MAGLLGELVFGELFGKHRCQYVGDRNLPYDYLLEISEGVTIKVDVKTKFRKVLPKKDFEASFFAYQGSNFFAEVDYYCFLSTTEKLDVVWFCGVANKQEWVKNPKGRLWKKGETDFSNNKTFDADTWSVQYKFLRQISPDDIYRIFIS